jgi:XTP/dITP diphosphohydrolase
MSLPTELLIATTNKAKLAEYQRLFKEFAPEIKLVTLDEVKVDGVPEETGTTFEENTILKGRFYAKQTGLLTLADDGGFEIDALGGEPGVKSRRWPGHRANDEELVRMTIDKLRGVQKQNRGAQLRVVAAVIAADGSVLAQEEGITRGVVAEQPAGWIEPYFPFRAVLWFEEFGKFYQDLTPKEHEQINHRRQVVKRLVGKMD